MKENIRKALNERKPERIFDPESDRAAVLVPLFSKNGELSVLFTKRTQTVEHHKGQISFPGGRKDYTDKNLLATALRESLEEIGLRKDAVELLGELDEEPTVVSNFIISPFVAVIPYPYPFKINKHEVAEIIEVSLTELLDTNNLQEETLTENGISISSYTFYVNDSVIWGATARIVKRFLDRICGNGDVQSS